MRYTLGSIGKSRALIGSCEIGVVTELIWSYLHISEGNISIHVVAVHINANKVAAFYARKELIDNCGRYMKTAHIYFLILTSAGSTG